MGGVLASLLARRSRGGGFVFIGGDFCRWFSAHFVAGDHPVAKTALGMVVRAGICSVCCGVVHDFRIFSSDARGAFHFASILVFMDCVGIFDALCAFGAD